MNIFDRMMSLDRRWVFLFLIIVCVIAYATDFQVPILIEPEVRSIFNFIDTLPKDAIMFIPLDYDPGTMAELHPMTWAIVEQCWRKEVKVLMTALSQNGPGMVAQALRQISDSMLVEKTYNGVTYQPREIVNGVEVTHPANDF